MRTEEYVELAGVADRVHKYEELQKALRRVKEIVQKVKQEMGSGAIKVVTVTPGMADKTIWESSTQEEASAVLGTVAGVLTQRCDEIEKKMLAI